jgi:hypothetical protein
MPVWMKGGIPEDALLEGLEGETVDEGFRIRETHLVE